MVEKVSFNIRDNLRPISFLPFKLIYSKNAFANYKTHISLQVFMLNR